MHAPAEAQSLRAQANPRTRDGQQSAQIHFVFFFTINFPEINDDFREFFLNITPRYTAHYFDRYSEHE
jgi:hypothetical protein